MKHVEIFAEGIIHPLDVVRSFAPEELLYPKVTPETMDEREERAWEKEKMRRRKVKEKKKREVTFVSTAKRNLSHTKTRTRRRNEAKGGSFDASTSRRIRNST